MTVLPNGFLFASKPHARTQKLLPFKRTTEIDNEDARFDDSFYDHLTGKISFVKTCDDRPRFHIAGSATNVIALHDGPRSIEIYDLKSGRGSRIDYETDYECVGNDCVAVDVSLDGRYVCWSLERGASLCDLALDAIQPLSVAHILAVKFSPNDRKLAYVTESSIKITDIPSDKALANKDSERLRDAYLSSTKLLYLFIEVGLRQKSQVAIYNTAIKEWHKTIDNMSVTDFDNIAYNDRLWLA